MLNPAGGDAKIETVSGRGEYLKRATSSAGTVNPTSERRESPFSNRMDLFRALLATEKPEIVGITETRIHTNTRDFEGEFEIPGYKTFKKDRLDREGGGVMLYVRGTWIQSNVK